MFWTQTPHSCKVEAAADSGVDGRQGGRQVYQQSMGRGDGEPVAPSFAAQRAPTASRRAGLNRIADRVIGEFSLVPVAPVLDVRAFGWTRGLRDNWRAIRDEAHAATLGEDQVRAHAPFTLWRGGGRESVNAARYPATAAAVATIPGLDSASFSVLPAGTYVPVQRGPTRGLLTCHLGLIVPRDGDARMRVGDRMVRWAEGETLVFDDTYDHEAWNDSGGTGVVLRIRVRRPLRQPGRWLADTLLRVRSALHR